MQCTITISEREKENIADQKGENWIFSIQNNGLRSFTIRIVVFAKIPTQACASCFSCHFLYFCLFFVFAPIPRNQKGRKCPHQIFHTRLSYPSVVSSPDACSRRSVRPSMRGVETSVGGRDDRARWRPWLGVASPGMHHPWLGAVSRRVSSMLIAAGSGGGGASTGQG